MDLHRTLRAADCALAAVILLILSPAMLALALAIRILSRRSPLVAHLRVGRHGQPLWMFKFRTMWSEAPPREEERGWRQQVISREVGEVKPLSDPRVTSRFAAWCRTYSVDELPQLWHAARGEMSLVGPRPLTDIELEKHYGERMSEVLSIPPGMTGLWQIKGRNALTYRQRRRLDLFLARKYSWRLYVWILLRTIPRVLSGAGAW